MNELAQCTDSNESFNLFKDLVWRIYQRESFSPESLELYSLVFLLIKNLSNKTMIQCFT